MTDDTAITLEYLQGSGEGTADDIAVGSVLEVVLDDERVIIRTKLEKPSKIKGLALI